VKRFTKSHVDDRCELGWTGLVVTGTGMKSEFKLHLGVLFSVT
jgi:hypothetical protein